jgi:hypothetical protein
MTLVDALTCYTRQLHTARTRRFMAFTVKTPANDTRLRTAPAHYPDACRCADCSGDAA